MHSGPDGDASPATSGSGLGISFGLDKKGKQGRLSVFVVGGRLKKLDRGQYIRWSAKENQFLEWGFDGKKIRSQGKSKHHS